MTVKVVIGDWIPCHDRRTGWDTPGAQIITEWWKAIETGEVPAFLENTRWSCGSSTGGRDTIPERNPVTEHEDRPSR